MKVQYVAVARAIPASDRHLRRLRVAQIVDWIEAPHPGAALEVDWPRAWRFWLARGKDINQLARRYLPSQGLADALAASTRDAVASDAPLK